MTITRLYVRLVFNVVFNLIVNKHLNSPFGFLFRNAFGSIFTLFLFLTLNLFSQILLSLRCDIHQNISILLLIHLTHIYSHTNASHSQTFLCTSNRTEYNKTISFGLPCNMIATQCEFFNLSLQIMVFLKSSQTCRIHVQYLPHED